MSSSNNFNEAPTYIFSCSGAADVGELADRSARKMARDGLGKMYCLAGIGGNVDIILRNTKAAKAIVVLDGCPQACGKKTLDRSGIQNYQHVELSTLGFEKTKSPATDESIASVARECATLIHKD